MEVITLNLSGTAYSINVKTNWYWDDETNTGDVINFQDFNRIEQNIVVIRNYLSALQYVIPSLTSVTNRTESFIEFLSSINRLEQNLETIRQNFLDPDNYPGSKVWARGSGFSADDANRLEQNIKLLFVNAGLVAQSLVFCGTIYAGYTRGDLVVL